MSDFNVITISNHQTIDKKVLSGQIFITLIEVLIGPDTCYIGQTAMSQ